MLGTNFVYAQLIECYRLAQNSRDLSSQNGAILFDREGYHLGKGYNDFANGVEYTLARATERPVKYEYFEHAERNAIFNAARDIDYWTFQDSREPFTDCQMVCPWAACADCARAIIQIGAKHLYVHKQRMDLTSQGAHATQWASKVVRALGMLLEAGIEIHYHDGWLKGAPSVLADGKLWSPAGAEASCQKPT